MESSIENFGFPLPSPIHEMSMQESSTKINTGAYSEITKYFQGDEELAVYGIIGDKKIPLSTFFLNNKINYHVVIHTTPLYVPVILEHVSKMYEEAWNSEK